MKELIKILTDPYKAWAADDSEQYSKWAFLVIGLGMVISAML